ncbi:FMN-dependent NADH-azoreductase [Dyadobacter sp. SG02]|uniref:FMN-dependent NADH-azoreductase n=1 Tax=Dyadobacter sp. SG02 TaxID=1855291 RepID=UPI0008C0D8A5|nr:NAD(P)H-dependent oxidoreductase [Dyadobacter sp. SG02]SEJ58795.1 FMN-dependent NADH-azoreductase [Dyadobacter sp. SG02]
MKQLLVIDSSARALRSHSREMTREFVKQWQDRYPGSTIISRDLTHDNVPHITEKWVSAAFTPEASRSEEAMQILETSEQFVSELHAADVIVIGAPMYNWSIPSPLKAYIDHVMRVNRTFRVNRGDKQNPYIGLLQNKTLVLLLSRGSAGYGPGEDNQHMNFQDNYLKTVFNVMGISDIHTITIDGASTQSDELVRSIECAETDIRTFIRHYHQTEDTYPTINQ